MRQHAIRAVFAALIVAWIAACSPSPPPPPSEDGGRAGASDAAAPRDGRIESFDGVPIAYTVRGRGLPALVFVHGWMCDRGYWAAQVAVFGGTSTVVTLDLAGHGDSGDGRQAWTMASFGRDVEAVVEGLGLESVILVGHSMGGIAALEAAARLKGKVVGVIGVDALHNFEFDWPEQAFDELVAAYRNDFPGTCRRFVESMFTETSDEELRARVTEHMCSGEPDVKLAQLSEFREVNYPELARAAAVPIRCINAAAVPTAIDVNRKYAPDFDAQVMQGVGHFLHMERPEEFNALLARAVEELTGSAQP